MVVVAVLQEEHKDEHQGDGHDSNNVPNVALLKVVGSFTGHT